MKYKIETPSKTFKGKRFGIPFVKGVGYTENPIIADELKHKGYKVSEIKDAPVDPWASVTVKQIDAYTKKFNIVFADDVKNKGQKVEALEVFNITPEMIINMIDNQKEDK